MFVSIARSVFLYILVVAAFRIMGKRQIGELQPIDLAIAIMISDLACIPMQDKDIPLISGIIPIATLIIIEILLSFLTLKSKRMRDFISGTPSILIRKGKIIESELIKLHLNIDDLIIKIRGAGYPDISDVDYAILETDGQLSVIPKPLKSPVTLSDLNLSPQKIEQIPYTIISDGRIIKDNIIKIQKDEKWLYSILKSKNINKPSQVLYMNYCNDNNFFIQKYSKKETKK